MNKQDVLFLPYDLQWRSRKRFCCLGNPGKYLGVQSFLEMIDPRYLLVLDFLNLSPFSLSLVESYLDCLLISLS